jgi:transglycosylase-like protein with SLT domain
MSLQEFHRAFPGGVRWRLVAAGVDVEGTGVERTAGAPATVTRIWNTWSREINATARARRVPCALIVATIATESGGKADAVRLEPGYRSDAETPHKVSPGLMQTLISTAREAMRLSCDRAWLLEPANSIEAGTAYIARQGRLTSLDPPLVAAAYNAGRLAEQTSEQNRWRLRQYPIGTGKHCDRFVRFFNDAVAVLATHAVPPAVGHAAVAAGEAPPPKATTSAQKEPVIAFAERARAEDVTAYSRGILADILRRAKLERALVSSTRRSPADQARVMYANLEQHGAEHGKRLYKGAGQKVVDTYVAAKRGGKDAASVQAAMVDTIDAVGPEKVSKHAADPKRLNVFDVAPSSIRDPAAFESAVRGERRVARFLVPPSDPGYHLEIPQPQA